MNQKLIKQTLIMFVLLASISFCGHKGQSHSQQNRKGHQQQHITNMPQIQPQSPTTMNNQNIISQNQPIQQVAAQNNPIANMANNMINPAYQNEQLTNIMSSNISANGMTMTIVEQLDPIKAAQLVADIYALKQNFFILSEILEATIKKNFNLGFNSQQNLPQNPNMPIYRLNDPAFDPTKQIINPAGGYRNAPAPQPTAINPFTNTPITLFDLPILKQIRRLLLSNVQLILFALGDIDACSWNAQQMISNMPIAKSWSAQNANRPNAYSLNMVRPLWKQSTDYILEGGLKKGILRIK